MLLLVILPPMSVCCWCNPAARAGSLCTALAAILRTRDYMGEQQQLLELGSVADDAGDLLAPALDNERVSLVLV